ncbi:MAG TPA: Ig-like domain-containing protein, partial [Gemmatimonadales bacterium]
MLTLLALLSFQAPATPQTPTVQQASPIARLVVTPGLRVTMPAQDSIRLSATPVDAEGRPVPGATVQYFSSGGRFEGAVDSTGKVTSGSTGTITVTIVARVPGTRPVTERVEVSMVAGPAARIDVGPATGMLVVGQRIRLEATAFSRAGDRRYQPLAWSSSASRVASVRADGMVTALAPGEAVIAARETGAGESGPRGELRVRVLATPVASVDLTPATTAAKQGDVIRFKAVAKDAQGKEIPGLTPQWTMSSGKGVIEADGAFTGYDPGTYVISASFGNRSADATVTLAPRDVRRPATVVGRLPRTRFTTEEVWIHPNGRNAYLGSGSGGDVLYTLDISDPAKPTVTDSIVTNTRRVNDVMSTPDGKVIVFTREGASDRRNGIVIASTEDPAHPKVIAEFTEGVTAGVHSAFIYQQPKYGTHVYLTNDGTGAMHVIDISDPSQPREVAQWKTSRPDAGRTLHDIDIQNGLAYLSYWNDGLVVLDVGNGIKGGTPASPQLVSQVKYDLNALYRDVEAAGGPGFIRGTHTAWRHKNYVFIADEVFPASGVRGAKDASAGRAYGRMQVVDVTDLAKPKIVAWYEPEFGGVHNIWVAGDTLYMGAYNAGFRAFDITGELRGDLRAQGREMVHVHTADMEGFVKNAAM